MKKIIFFLTAFLIFGEISIAQETKKAEEICYNPNAKGDTTKRSIKSAAVGKIGTANITINYHSPGVRKRTIWGGLVPYNDVWVTGAHSATTIEIDKDFTVAGTRVPKGKYAIFTIPAKNQWTIIINKVWNQHLADDYQPSEDVVRIKVKPLKQAKSMERLQYYITDHGKGKGTIAVAWEKLRVDVGISVQK